MTVFSLIGDRAHVTIRNKLGAVYLKTVLEKFPAPRLVFGLRVKRSVTRPGIPWHFSAMIAVQRNSVAPVFG
jgi:hypothetical protein